MLYLRLTRPTFWKRLWNIIIGVTTVHYSFNLILKSMFILSYISFLQKNKNYSLRHFLLFRILAGLCHGESQKSVSSGAIRSRKCEHPDRTFHNFRTRKCVPQLILCNSETFIDGFWGTEIVKCSVGRPENKCSGLSTEPFSFPSEYVIVLTEENM